MRISIIIDIRKEKILVLELAEFAGFFKERREIK